jgi:predicted phosphodiesterase
MNPDRSSRAAATPSNADVPVLVGLVADTHCIAPDGSDLPAAAVDALAGCTLVVHLGDLTSLGVLDRLAATGAEVLGIRNVIDPPADTDHRLVEGPVERTVAGRMVVFTRTRPTEADVLSRPDVIAYGVPAGGGGHDHAVSVVDGTLLVSPGSPTKALRHPTVARLSISANTIDVEVVHLR